MKKTLVFLVIVLFVSTIGYAQEYKPFQLYVGVGFASPGAGGVGVLIDLEPSYRINDKIAIGFRLESAAMAKEVTVDIDSEISAVGSYTLNGRYYFGDSNFRPYIGAGFGIYALGTVKVDDPDNAGSADFGTKFGFYPRIGFDFGHFNINIDYNLVPEYEGANATSYSGTRL